MEVSPSTCSQNSKHQRMAERQTSLYDGNGETAAVAEHCAPKDRLSSPPAVERHEGSHDYLSERSASSGLQRPIRPRAKDQQLGHEMILVRKRSKSTSVNTRFYTSAKNSSTKLGIDDFDIRFEFYAKNATRINVLN